VCLIATRSCRLIIDDQLLNRCLASTYKYFTKGLHSAHAAVFYGQISHQNRTRLQGFRFTIQAHQAPLRCVVEACLSMPRLSCCLRLKDSRVSLHHTSTYAEMTLYKSAQNYFAAHLLHGCARAHQVLLPSSPALPLQSSGSDVQLLNRCLASTCKYYDKGLHSEASNDILRGRSTPVPRHHCIRFCGCDALLLAAHQRYTTARCTVCPH
jgi:hypothetical protein